MANQAAKNIAALVNPIEVAFPNGRFTAKIKCQSCDRTDKATWPVVQQPQSIVKKFERKGWQVDLKKGEIHCSPCVQEEKARRKSKPALTPPPQPALPKRSLPMPNLSIQDQIEYLIQEQPGISSREIAGYFPDRKPDAISAQISILYAQGGYRREFPAPKNKGGSGGGFRYWKEPGAKPQMIRVAKKDQAPKYAGPVTEPPYIPPSNEEIQMTSKTELMSSTLISGRAMVPAEVLEDQKPDPKPSDASRAAKRYSYELLLEHYDTEKRRYKGDWSDQAIASKTGYAVAAVAKLREEDFGPAGPPAQLVNMKEALTRLEHRAQAMETKVSQEIDELSTIQGLIAALRRDMDRLVEAHGWED